MHSFFSSDSEAPTEEMVKRAVELGLPAICLTDHYDMDYSTGEFQLDTPAYAAKIRELQEKYHDRIDIRFGVELGLQLHLKERMEEYVNAWPFDYVIGSMHVIDGKDPYYEDAFPDWTAEELYRAYFRATAENIRFFHNFQTLGHLDYVVRYCREKGKDYSYRAFADEIDTILKELIQLFREKHACTKEEITAVFEKFGAYECRQMPDGMDFDYVIYFTDSSIDAYDYCIREEMGHTIYHRFARADFEALMTIQ